MEYPTGVFIRHGQSIRSIATAFFLYCSGNQVIYALFCVTSATISSLGKEILQDHEVSSFISIYKSHHIGRTYPCKNHSCIAGHTLTGTLGGTLKTDEDFEESYAIHLWTGKSVTNEFVKDFPDNPMEDWMTVENIRNIDTPFNKLARRFLEDI